MNRPVVVLVLMITMLVSSYTQEIGLNINYQLVDAKEWNRANQIYNSSRPFLVNKQPNLKHGFSFGFYYLWKPEHTFSFGPSIAFSFHRSASQNPNFDIDINALLMDLGMKIQYRPFVEQDNHLHLSFTPSLTALMLSRKLNGEIAILGETEEDDKLRKIGFGVGLNAQIAYDISLSDNWLISPVFGISYKPYVWANRSDIIFNEAATGDLKSNTSMWAGQAGIILKASKNPS